MSSRDKRGTLQQKRYEKLLSDPKHRSKKKADKRRYDVLLNLVALAALLYGGSYLVPQKDKQEIAEFLGDWPGNLTGAARQTTEAMQIAGLSGVISSLMPAIHALPKPSPPGTAARGTAPPGTAARGEQASAIVGSLISMGDFPRGRDDWQRIEFPDARAAAEALQQIDRALGRAPVPLAPVDALQDRKAVIYDGGASLRFVIVVEVRQPDRPQPVAAAAGPAPQVMSDVPGAPRPPRAERSATDIAALPPSPIAHARIEKTPANASSAVDLAGLTFINHAGDQPGDLVDLRAELPDNRAVYIRGRARLTVIEGFLSRADLAGIGLKS